MLELYKPQPRKLKLWSSIGIFQTLNNVKIPLNVFLGIMLTMYGEFCYNPHVWPQMLCNLFCYQLPRLCKNMHYILTIFYHCIDYFFQKLKGLKMELMKWLVFSDCTDVIYKSLANNFISQRNNSRSCNPSCFSQCRFLETPYRQLMLVQREQNTAIYIAKLFTSIRKSTYIFQLVNLKTIRAKIYFVTEVSFYSISTPKWEQRPLHISKLIILRCWLHKIRVCTNIFL